MKYVIFKVTHRATGQYFIGKMNYQKWQSRINTAMAYGTGRDIMALVKEHGMEAFDLTELKRFKSTGAALEFKTSQINVNDPLCLNIKEKAYSGHTGHKHSPQASLKLSKALTGKPSHNKGVPMSQENREKIRKANLGRKLSQQHRDRIGEANRGRTHSPETRAKIGESHKGRVVTEETRARISLSATGRRLSPESLKKRRANMKAKRDKNKNVLNESPPA